MNLPNITGRDRLSFKALIISHNSLYLQELSVVFVHEPWCNILDFRFSDDGIDIVINQSFFTIVGRKRPCVYPIKIHKIIQQLRNRFNRGLHKSVIGLLMFDFCFPPFCFGVCTPCFPFLMPYAFFIIVIIDNRVFAFSFCNRCHFLSPLIFNDY